MTKIKVSQAHIDAGKRRSWYGCPVALAASESFDKPAWVDGANRRIVVDATGDPLHHCIGYDFDDTTKAVIEAYDAGGEMAPFDLWISRFDAGR